MGELADKTKGTVKDIKGKVTGDKSERAKGKGLKARGKLKGALNDVMDRGNHSGPTVDRDTMAPDRP